MLPLYLFLAGLAVAVLAGERPASGDKAEMGVSDQDIVIGMLRGFPLMGRTFRWSVQNDPRRAFALLNMVSMRTIRAVVAKGDPEVAQADGVFLLECWNWIREQGDGRLTVHALTAFQVAFLQKFMNEDIVRWPHAWLQAGLSALPDIQADFLEARQLAVAAADHMAGLGRLDEAHLWHDVASVYAQVEQGLGDAMVAKPGAWTPRQEYATPMLTGPATSEEENA